MKRPTDAHTYAVYEAHERQRAAEGRMDTADSITRTAEALGLSYAEVQRVVVAKLCMGMGF